MKRLISLILAVALLLSLAPAVFADGEETGGVALTFGEIREIEQDVYDTTDKVKYYAIPVMVKNATSEDITLNALQCIFNYNESGLVPANIQADEYSFIEPITFSIKPVSEWESKDGNAANGRITVIATTTKSNYYVKLKAGQERVLFEMNLARVSDVENGDYNVTFSDPYLDDGYQMQNKIGYDDTVDGVPIHISYSQSDKNLDLTDEGKITITDGQVPTLASITATTEDGENAVYGTPKTYTLKVFSTSGKDITSLVEFTSDADKGITITGAALTTGTATPAGTYEITATAKDASSVTIGEYTKGSFTVDKMTLTDAAVTINGFGKGQLAKDVTATLLDKFSSYSAAVSVVTEDETLKASTEYTLTITLTPDENHKFDNGVTLTVKGLGDDAQTVELTKNEDGTYSATATGTTPDKDVPTITLDAISATYGDLLSKYEPTGTATFNGNTVAGEFAWSAEYDDDTTVGNVGKNTFNVVFKPTDEENYKAVNGTVEVTVAQKEIDITGKLNEWSASEFTYDGDRHAVELKIDADLDGIVKVQEYTGDTEAQDAGEYTATASLELVDPKNYVFTEGTVLTREHTWKINKGDLTPTNAEKSVLFGTKEVTFTPADFGLTQDGIEIVDVQMGTSPSLIQSYSVSADKRSATFTLRDTNKTDAASSATDTATLKFSSANYNETHGTLTIKIIDKKTDADTLQIDVPATVTYGDTVAPSVGESKPTGAGDVTFMFFDKDGNQVSDQPFPVGKYKVTASCEDDSTIYTAEKEFAVVARELTEENVTFGENLVYTGNELTQIVTVTVNGKTLTAGTDYTVSSLTGTEPGSYPVTVTGTGNYTGEVTKSFTISKAQISSAAITYDAGPYGYTGEEWEPEVAVSFNGIALTADTDYTVSYENNINAGTAKIIITGIGDHFTGSTEKTFIIKRADISGCTIASIAAVTYNAKAHTPEVTVAISGRTLKADKDYTVSYDSNVNAGTANVTVTGNGNYTGTKTATFEIKKADLSLSSKTLTSLYTETEEKTEDLSSVGFCADEPNTKFTVTIGEPDNGAIFTQKPAVVSGENKVTYQLNGTTGTASVEVSVEPTSKNYNSGVYTLTFVVNDKTNVSGSISFPDGSAVYTGSGIAYERATLNGNSFNMTYSYSLASNGAKLDEKGLPLTVGAYTVTAAYSDANSYGAAKAVFTITKATPTGTPTCTKFESSGKTLADTELSVGSIRPAGTIAWDLPLTTVLEDGKAYAWTFTPNDTHNYTILTGTLIPYVDDGMDYIPGVIGGSTTGSFTFHDVSRADYFYNAVKWAAENGIASGTSRYNFSPDAVCTRAQTVTFLWRAAGSPLPRYRVSPFTDVNASDYYYNAVLWAVEQGITTGLNATTFGPDETVTRGQVATFLYRAASAAKPNTFNPFTDVKSTAYNYDAILWAYDNRITTGTSDTTFSPDAFCTRAQIVTFLYRFYQGR